MLPTPTNQSLRQANLIIRVHRGCCVLQMNPRKVKVKRETSYHYLHLDGIHLCRCGLGSRLTLVSWLLRLQREVTSWLPELHADLLSRHASPLEFCILWRSTKEVNMFCSTRFVVDATENSKEGGVAADVCSSQTGLWTKSIGNVLLLLPGSPNEVTFFVGGISERRSINTIHHPIFQWEAMRVSAKTLHGGWVGIGWWVWVTKWKKNDTPEYSSQVTIKTNLLAELKHQAPNYISNSSNRELPRDMFRFKTVWNYLG